MLVDLSFLSNVATTRPATQRGGVDVEIAYVDALGVDRRGCVEGTAEVLSEDAAPFLSFKGSATIRESSGPRPAAGMWGSRRPRHAIRYVQTMLEPGDVILAGTPIGVSRLYLGDEVEVRIDGLEHPDLSVQVEQPEPGTLL